VILDGLVGNEQDLTDLLVGFSGADEVDDFPFARRNRVPVDKGVADAVFANQDTGFFLPR
jgi:hypothetical protein